MSAQPLDDLLARLERERLHADRLYHEALTALDRAIQPSPIWPPAPPLPDGARLAELNAWWNLLPDGAPTVDRSLKGRLRGFIWRLIGPPLETQKRFNAALVDHLNRNWATQQALPKTFGRLLDTLGLAFGALVQFEFLLLEYLRTVTLYVDTKDRRLGASEFGERLGWLEQRLLALQREPRGPFVAERSTDEVLPVFTGPIDSAAYVGFENRFRGSSATIRERAAEYVALLSGCSGVLDLGCGRGELLALLRERGVSARGIDQNSSMVALCQSEGLDVEEADALSYLRHQADGSVGGLVAIQVVEHFEPGYLLHVLETAYQKMRVGAPLILETVNPACWMAFFEVYIRDPTHQRPLHPDTLKYLVEASGFRAADVRFRHPVAEADRLPRVALAAPPEGEPDAVAQLGAVVNAHADALNARLFSFTDYAVIARR